VRLELCEEDACHCESRISTSLMFLLFVFFVLIPAI